MSNLYVLCGVPGCGKTLWTQNKMSENGSSGGLLWDYVSRDEVRYSLIDEEDDYFAKEKTVFKEFARRIAEKLDDPAITNVIADATHLNEISRNKLLNALPHKPTNIIMVYFDVPLKTCVFRNNKRTGRARVPEEVLTKMYGSLEFPRLRPGLLRVEIVRD